jgi:hypothetical protein
MNTRLNFIAATAVVATLALSTVASAEVAMFHPSSPYGWGQIDTPDVSGDAWSSAVGRPRHQPPHGIEPYGQW